MIDRNAIVAATANLDDREAVEMPAWGGIVYVAPLTLGDIRKASKDAEAKGIAEMSVYLCRSIQDEAGDRIFLDADAEAIDKMSLAAVKPLTEAVNAVNGFDDDEDAEGNAPAKS
ncbi:MAG: hypothetical protein AAF589_00680 [Planctomycetota bacterium]